MENVNATQLRQGSVDIMASLDEDGENVVLVDEFNLLGYLLD